MKRVIALVLAVLMLASVALFTVACGDNGSKSTETETKRDDASSKSATDTDTETSTETDTETDNKQETFAVTMNDVLCISLDFSHFTETETGATEEMMEAVMYCDFNARSFAVCTTVDEEQVPVLFATPAVVYINTFDETAPTLSCPTQQFAEMLNGMIDSQVSEEQAGLLDVVHVLTLAAQTYLTDGMEAAQQALAAGLATADLSALDAMLAETGFSLPMDMSSLVGMLASIDPATLPTTTADIEALINEIASSVMSVLMMFSEVEYGEDGVAMTFSTDTIYEMIDGFMETLPTMLGMTPLEIIAMLTGAEEVPTELIPAEIKALLTEDTQLGELLDVLFGMMEMNEEDLLAIIAPIACQLLGVDEEAFSEGWATLRAMTLGDLLDAVETILSGEPEEEEIPTVPMPSFFDMLCAMFYETDRVVALVMYVEAMAAQPVVDIVNSFIGGFEPYTADALAEMIGTLYESVKQSFGLTVTMQADMEGNFRALDISVHVGGESEQIISVELSVDTVETVSFDLPAELKTIADTNAVFPAIK